MIVEDDRDDADLLVLELQRFGYQAQTRRVDTLEQLQRSLAAEPWEIVISDFNLADFTALEALETVKQTGRDIPFIVVSSTIGEETAALAMKRGAHDFFLKDRVNRLPLAVEREVREAENRRERREAIARIAENERRFRAIFNQSIAGIAQLDLHGRITVVNEQYARITGRPAAVLQGMDIRCLAQDQHREELDRAFTSAIELASGSAFESCYVRLDGTVIWVEHNLSVVVDQDGRPSFAVAIVQDITARKQMEEQLRQAVAMRDDFLAMASHELKTPVTSLELVLSSSLRVLEGGESAAAIEKVRQRLLLATKQVDRLTTLIRNLLDVTRIASGRLTLTRTHVDLRDIVRASMERLAEVIERSGSTIAIDARVPTAGRFDIEAMDTVITNLLANATKYGMGKPIDVTVGADGGRARIVVSDRGLGIDPVDQQRIFERFERAVPSRHFGGFGIGLWIVRNIVEAHGGTIRVSSVQGQGSSFIVDLPLVEAM